MTLVDCQTLVILVIIYQLLLSSKSSSIKHSCIPGDTLRLLAFIKRRLKICLLRKWNLYNLIYIASAYPVI